MKKGEWRKHVFLKVVFGSWTSYLRKTEYNPRKVILIYEYIIHGKEDICN